MWNKILTNDNQIKFFFVSIEFFCDIDKESPNKNRRTFEEKNYNIDHILHP